MHIPITNEIVITPVPTTEMTGSQPLEGTSAIPSGAAAAPATFSGPSVEETDAFFARVRAMIKSREFGKDRNVLAIIAITECIEFGFDTRKRIIGACRQLDFKTAHIFSLLNHEAGEQTDLHRWRRSDEGRYTLIG